MTYRIGSHPGDLTVPADFATNGGLVGTFSWTGDTGYTGTSDAAAFVETVFNDPASHMTKEINTRPAAGKNMVSNISTVLQYPGLLS